MEWWIESGSCVTIHAECCLGMIMLIQCGICSENCRQSTHGCFTLLGLISGVYPHVKHMYRGTHGHSNWNMQFECPCIFLQHAVHRVEQTRYGRRFLNKLTLVQQFPLITLHVLFSWQWRIMGEGRGYCFTMFEAWELSLVVEQTTSPTKMLQDAWCFQTQLAFHLYEKEQQLNLSH